MTHRVLTVALAASLFPHGARADEELDRVRHAHSASLAQITTLHSKITTEVSILDDAVLPPAVAANKAALAKRVESGEYWRSGDRVRVTETHASGSRTLIKDLRSGAAYVMPGRDRPGGPVEQLKGSLVQFPSNLDMADGILFCLPRPVPPDYDAYPTLERAMARSKSARGSRDRIDGEDLYRIDLDTGDDVRIQVWLAPGVNYLFKRISVTREGKPSVEIRVTDFAEVKAGVFCPTRVERTVHKATKWVTTISDIRINEPLAAGLFDPRVPPGSVVANFVEGKTYTVGPNGQPERVIGHIIRDESAPSGSPSPPIGATPLDADDPPRWPTSRIVLFASIALGTLGVFLLIRRRAGATNA